MGEDCDKKSLNNKEVRIIYALRETRLNRLFFLGNSLFKERNEPSSVQKHAFTLTRQLVKKLVEDI